MHPAYERIDTEIDRRVDTEEGQIKREGRDTEREIELKM